MKGFILYQTYDKIGEKTVVQLFGRLENNQTFVALNTLEPYFFIKESDLKGVEKYPNIRLKKQISEPSKARKL
jgi:hypothetical protein